MNKQKNNMISRKDAAALLDSIYAKAINGIPKVSQPIGDIADDYLKKNSSKQKAAKSLIEYQIVKCGTSGFLTGLGGVVTLPVAIPANLGSVIYVQLRMIAGIAQIGGYDISSDQVRTMAYACLTGSAAADILKQTGIKAGEKMAEAALKKIPGGVLKAINQKVGFRLITRFGTKGAVNLVKMVPLAGGVIGAGVDIASTKVIADNAYRLFISKKMLSNNKKKQAKKSAKK